MTLRKRFWPYLVALGPGLLAASAGNDAGGIATYASAGASYGYGLLWAMVLVTVCVGVVQEMSARMGAVTGKGFSDLVRESFTLRQTALILLTLLIANTGIIVSEFIGVAAAAELFGVSRYIAVPLAAIFVWLLVTRGSYGWVERIFLVLTLAFLAYIGAAFLAKPDWHAVLAETLRPHLHFDFGYLNLLIALIGTTISPYMQLYIQSSVVEKGVTPDEYRYTRFDVDRGDDLGGDRGHLHHHRHRGDPLSARHQGRHPRPTRRRRWSRWRGNTPRCCSAWGCWEPRCWRPGCCRSPPPT